LVVAPRSGHKDPQARGPDGVGTAGTPVWETAGMGNRRYGKPSVWETVGMRNGRNTKLSAEKGREGQG